MRVALIAVSAAALAAALILTNTRFGVYVVLDYFGDDESGIVTDPREGPIEIPEFARAAPLHPLPEAIDQPSGISYIETLDTFVVCTDQAELFALTGDLLSVRSLTLLQGGLLLMRQGSREGITALDSERVALAGEQPTIDVWRGEPDAGYSMDAEVAITGYVGEMEFAGIAYDDGTGEYFLAVEGGLTVLVANGEGEVIRSFDLGEGAVRVKAGRDAGEYEISGLAFYDGLLYAVTENFNTIFVVDPRERSVRAIGIEGGALISDIAVADGRAYLTVDHNYVDERPALLVVDLRPGRVNRADSARHRAESRGPYSRPPV